MSSASAAAASARPFLTFLLLALLVGVYGGFLSSTDVPIGVNDGSRLNTVWSLVAYGDYQIYTTPEQAAQYGRVQQLFTIDKVMVNGKEFSDKAAFLPTVMAGVVKVIQLATGIEFGQASLQFFVKLLLVCFNLVPLLSIVYLYSRFLATLELDDAAWAFCLLASLLGTLYTGYLGTINNHTPAAWGAFVCAYLLVQVFYFNRTGGWRLSVAGVAAGFAGACDPPAGLVALAALCWGLWLRPRLTLLCFLPPLALVLGAFVLTNYLSIGRPLPAPIYPELFDYPGSYWHSAAKSAIDALNDNPESVWVYLMHMTVGHHGFFSMTPIWIIALAGLFTASSAARDPIAALRWPVLLVTLFAFIYYVFINDHRNYGGHAHGMRWLLWLHPLWLLLLPTGLSAWMQSRVLRAIAAALLAVSAFTVADALVQPWAYSMLHHLFLALGWVNY